MSSLGLGSSFDADSQLGSLSPPVSPFHRPDHGDMFSTNENAALNSVGGDQDDLTSYDLKPPEPKSEHANIDVLSVRFFSADHLNVILRDQKYSRQFLSFLQHYKPHLVPQLNEWLSTQKALTAVEYANAVVEHLAAAKLESTTATTLDVGFTKRAAAAANELAAEALPAFLSNRLVQIVTDTLVKEITGNGTPLMRDMIPSLAEVYCVTDPSLPDNPIVYASEEFYAISQYTKDYVIGRNCRFLQGPKTSNASVARMVEALKTGQECTETLLNYRRDGTPFLNLLMIAPLYDNKGAVRYFLGCQVDVSSLIEDGRGFQSFAQLLSNDRTDSRIGFRQSKQPSDILADLSGLLSTDELSGLRNATLGAVEETTRAATPSPRHAKNGRRILGMEEEPPTERTMWPDRSFGPSGRLPGVYSSYLLVRPFPSLRITFTSPALRFPGLLQTKFLDRIGGPPHVYEGILDAFSSGTSVTAKVNWLPLGAGGGGRDEPRQRWIHCTPLMGSDEKVGVWMIVLVESEEVAAGMGRLSIGGGGGVNSPVGTRPMSSGSSVAGRSTRTFTSEQLYQQYLRGDRKEGGGVGPSSRTSSRG